MTYTELNTYFETIATTYLGVAYHHCERSRFNLYRGEFPVVLWNADFLVDNVGKVGDPLATLADRYKVDLYFIDQHKSDWSIDLIQPIVNTQMETAKEFLWVIEMEKSITNSKGVTIERARRARVLQEFDKTCSGALMFLELITPNTTIQPGC